MYAVQRNLLEPRRGRRLHPGDRVRLVSPASFPSEEGLAESIGILSGWGFQVEVGKHAMDRWGYMAGHDEHRLADLNDALRDPAVRAVIATRGGAGAYRIVDGLDYEAARADPKPLVGFSDITNLHLALWRHCHLATIHGCVAGRFATGVRTLLTSTEPTVLTRNRKALTAGIEVPGSAAGPLIGGHLTTLVGFVGAGLPSLDGAILLLEMERTIGLGQVDRALTQLIRSGSLQGVAGIALGRFVGYDEYRDRDWNVHDVLRDRLSGLGVPVLGGLDIGHGEDPLPVPLGAHAHLDTQSGSLTVGPAVL